jgi:hypothetical protein
LVAPTVSLASTNVVATVGNNTSLSVSAAGTGPLTYQWYFGPAPIVGATNPTLLLTNVSLTAMGDYTVLVTGAGGTAFGTATLTVNPAVAVPAPWGLTNWWPAEGTAVDVVSGMNGTLYGAGAGYGPGEVNQAFHLTGAYGYATFGPTAGAFGTNDFSIEFWVRSTAGIWGEYPLLEKAAACNASNGFTIRLEGQGFTNPQPGTLVADLGQTGGAYVRLQSTRTVTDGWFHHVALVRQNTNLTLYLDGTVETNGFASGVISVGNTAALVVGTSPCVGADGRSSYFAGDVDELALYSRALLTSEVQGIYNAAGAGKQMSPPVISSQPTNQTAWLGSNATFSVTATGYAPLTYQWYGVQAGALANATNAQLTLPGVQAGNSDSYYVVVSNGAGVATSVGAVLTVINGALDSTGDGLPDTWAQEYFGTVNVNPNASPAGTGWTILQDYLYGANPTSAAAPFLLNVTQPGGNSTIP